MNKKTALTVLLAIVAGVTSCLAQGRGALRINEVMVSNTSGVVDEYGERNAWIELFNSNFAPVEISSIYLTDDPSNPTKYPVPLGDVNTNIPKRQHVLFFADGEPNKGTFHTSFTLVPGKDLWIGIYDANGITLIDSVSVPAYLLENQSWARTEDGAGHWALRTGGPQDYITPSSANIIRDGNHKIQDFKEKDENGFGMTIMAMCIVFSALLILCLCFYAIGRIGQFFHGLNKRKALGGMSAENSANSAAIHDSGEEIAAIVMALHEHLNAHDTENTILTINKVKRAYSPWSSKIYNIRRTPDLHK